jgi:TonB family protein
MMLILQQCTAVDFSDMSNNFSLILTKKRIKMITKHEKAKGFWWKLLATLPVLALLLIVNARASAQQVKKTDETVYEISTKDITNVKIKKVDNDSIYQIVEVMPEFPGGTEKMMDYLSKNIKYPEAAKEKGISGRVFLSFVIEKDGAVSDVKVVKGIGKECDDEALRVVKAMPKWKPGLMKGKPVRVSYMLPIFFKLDESEKYAPVKGETVAPQADLKPGKDGVWDIAETMPEYPGGMDGLRAFMQDNLTMPKKYKEMDTKAEYRVFVQFVVAEDGSITNVELKKPEPSKKDLNDEAVRVVKSMPKWKPGTVDGKPVKVRYMLPVLFKLGK